MTSRRELPPEDRLRNLIGDVLGATGREGYQVLEVYAIAKVLDSEGEPTVAIATTMEGDPVGQVGLLRAELIRAEDKIRMIHDEMYRRMWEDEDDEDDD